MMDRYVVGGFYRVHAARGRDENLNAPGAQFVPLAFESPCIPDLSGAPGCAPNRFYAYGVIARLAQLEPDFLPAVQMGNDTPREFQRMRIIVRIVIGYPRHARMYLRAAQLFLDARPHRGEPLLDQYRHQTFKLSDQAVAILNV